jgi:hypothetical protein
MTCGGRGRIMPTGFPSQPGSVALFRLCDTTRTWTLSASNVRSSGRSSATRSSSRLTASADPACFVYFSRSAVDRTFPDPINNLRISRSRSSSRSPTADGDDPSFVPWALAARWSCDMSPLCAKMYCLGPT